MITLEKIYISNFRAFREKEFDFEKKALILLTAPNGFGKTSLVDAIEWCLTGTIRRLKLCFDDRGDKDIQNLKKGLIINCNAVSKQACVKLIMYSDESEMSGQIVVERIANDDKLEPKDTQLKINISDIEYTGEEAEKIIGRIISQNDFYNYHICDVQKAFRFLESNREDTYKQFADFITNYEELDAVTDNLDCIQKQLKKEKDKIESEIEKVKKEVQELENIISEHSEKNILIEYDKSITIYDGEILDISNIQKSGLENQLRNLNLCLLKIIYDLKTEIAENNKKIEAGEKINKLISELQQNGELIKAAIDSGYKSDDLIEVRKRLTEFEKIHSITEKTFSRYYNELLSMNPVTLDVAFISKSEENKKRLNEVLSDLENQIEMASEGNEIMKFFSELLSKKKVMVDYREQQKGINNKETVYCPVCGSKEFDTIPYTEILKRAKEYCDNQNVEIAKKSAKKADIENQIKEIWSEELVHVNAALKEVKDTLTKKVNELSRTDFLYKNFFKVVDEFNELTTEKLVLTEFGVNSLKERSQRITKEIKSREDIDAINCKINTIIAFIDEHDKGLGIKTDTPISFFKGISEKAPAILNDDVDHIFRKIDSLKSHLNCSNYTEKVNQKQEKDKVVKSLDGKLKRIGDICKKINLKIRDIRFYKTKQTNDEYCEIMVYLYHIFVKLCRNSDLKQLKNDPGRGLKNDTLTLKDDKDNPIQNIMSDGQLSVFMLSVFFSNAKRISNDKNNSEKLHCYFIDDITSCMDDINMLAFVDFIKYQTNGNDRCMDQLFFSTCDTRIQKLIRYKCEKAGIDWLEISADKFE